MFFKAFQSTPGYLGQRHLPTYPSRALLDPALTKGKTHPLYYAGSIQCRGLFLPYDLLTSYEPSRMLPCASRT